MGRFHINGLLGKGMYGAVYKSTLVALNSNSGEGGTGSQAIALKVHRANPLM